MTMPKGYFDRTPTIKSEKDMFERLQQRTQHRSGAVQNPQEAPSVVPSSATALVWMPPTKGCEAILTQCGHYSVSRAKVMGEYRYTAWLRLPTPTPLGQATPDAKSAQGLCEAHRQGIR